MRTCVFTLALPFFLLRGLKTFDKLLLKLEIYRSYFFCFVVFFRVVKNVHKYNNHCLCVLWAFIFFYHTIALWMQCGEERAVCTNIKNQYFFFIKHRIHNIKYLFGAIFCLLHVDGNYSSNKAIGSSPNVNQLQLLSTYCEILLQFIAWAVRFRWKFTRINP